MKSLFIKILCAVSFLLLTCCVAKAQANWKAAVSVKLTVVEEFPLSNSAENYEYRLVEERKKHEDPSEGLSGYYANVSFTKKMDGVQPVKARISFMIETDPLNPSIPLYTYNYNTMEQRSEKRFNMNPIVDFDYNMRLVPISFYVYSTEKVGEKIFAGYSEDMTPYREVTYLERTCKSYDSFEFFIPNDLTNLYYVCPEKKAPFDMAIYLKVDIYDKNDNWIGRNTNVPVIHYSRMPELQGSDWDELGNIDCEHVHKIEIEYLYYTPQKMYLYTTGTTYPDKHKVVWDEKELMFKKFKFEDIDNMYISEKIENDTIITMESAENYLSQLQAYCDSLDMKLEFSFPTEEEYCKAMNLELPEDIDEDVLLDNHYVTDSVLVSDSLYIIMMDVRERKGSKPVLIYKVPYTKIYKCVICEQILHEFQWSKFLTPIGLQRIRKKHPEIPAI